MTFRDFQELNEMWGEDQSSSMHTVYEAMRLQTYFQFSLQVDKKYKKSFDQFCAHYMPFGWDKDFKVENDDQTKLENMSAKDWAQLDRQQEERQKKIVHKKATAAML